jgi:outer membrane cobalamin receptor
MARLFRDSLSTTQFALYYSSIERTYSDAPSNIADTYSSSLRGTRIIQQLRSSLVRTSLGFDLQQARFRKNDDPPDDPSTHTALFGKAEVALLEVVTPSIAARAEQRGNQSALSYGVGARVKLSNLLTLRAEIASSYRFPTFQERQGLDTTASLFNKQNVVSRNVGIQLSLGDFGLVSITGYEHRISEASAIFFIDANPRPATDAAPGTDIRGMSSSLLLRWWNLEGIGAGSFTETTRSSRPNTLLPKWTFTGEVAYRSFISTVAEIRAGVRVLYTSRHRGTQFFPRTWSFRENSGAELSESLRLDLFTVAKIGDAYVTVSWENLLNEQYMLVSGYPMPNRTFRFGVNWQFID